MKVAFFQVCGLKIYDGVQFVTGSQLDPSLTLQSCKTSQGCFKMKSGFKKATPTLCVTANSSNERLKLPQDGSKPRRAAQNRAGRAKYPEGRLKTAQEGPNTPKGGSKLRRKAKYPEGRLKTAQEEPNTPKGGSKLRRKGQVPRRTAQTSAGRVKTRPHRHRRCTPNYWSDKARTKVRREGRQISHKQE